MKPKVKSAVALVLFCISLVCLDAFKESLKTVLSHFYAPNELFAVIVDTSAIFQVLMFKTSFIPYWVYQPLSEISVSP